MRALLGLCVAVAAVLGASQPASAAFSFILTPAVSSLTPGGPSQLLTVTAVDTNAGGFGTQFFLSSVSNVTGGNPNITFTTLSPFVANTTVYTATASGNVIGTITASATGPSGLTTIAFSGTIGNNNGGFAPGTTFTSNTATLTAVPEPTSMALVGIAGLGYVFYRKRRAAKA